MILALFAIFFVGKINATIPSDYVANYEITTDYNKILWLFVEIDSATKIWNQISQAKFSQLNTSFQTVFPKFPQDYAFKVTYQQCLDITQWLASYTSTDYEAKLSSFMTNCYKPFSDIVKKVNATYTVVANAKISPQSWPAPLTVTFDGRASVDPSNDTIPSKNYFRYYRDTDGHDTPIGVWPVVNTTFATPGNYQVHLTVRSSNKVTDGIFDGEKTMSIDVLPKTANIVVYANGQKLIKDGKIKIGIQEAEKGIIFDGSATLPMGWRQILAHNRLVTSKDGFSYTKDGDGKPSLMRLVLPGQWEYKLALTTTDNEANKITENYYILVSDPVAIIKQLPEKGNSSITFAFDSSPSYSIVSSLKLFTREIFDQNGNKIETFQGTSIKQQFKKPGVYTVKLTVEDELGQTNTDSLSVYVESTDPIPQFTITPSNNRKNPSEFILDASVSSDLDKTNGYDTLAYERSFSDPTKTKIINTENNNEKIKVQFDAIGKHTVKLTTRDDYGKITDISKDIEVKSILRPEIFVVPLATPWGNPMNFLVKSNQSIINYQWDFADQDTRTIQTDKISHTYKKSGVYTVLLKVSWSDGMENEVSKNVFVGEKNYPVAWYTVIDNASNIQTQNDECANFDWSSGTVSAYRIDRYQDFSIDPWLSVNTKWEKMWLQYFFQPQNNEIFKQDVFKYKFNELGCTYIDLTVEDTTISKSDKVRIYFKVINALPKLDNIILFFPQYGNQVGVGFSENNAKDIFNDTFDPLIVKVSATNAIDPDWFISYFKWYYYYKDDPSRTLETKITPWTIPYVFFSLPRVPGEFMFGVTMYDNDDGEQSNEDIIWNWPLVFFPPDVSRPDIPLVTLKSDVASTEIGDEVTFNVVSKIISDRPDFIRERTIQYDFDGDWTWDLTTKSDRVTHIYTEPNALWYRPRAAVLYRWYKWIGVWGTIVVQNWLKPMLLSDTFEKLAIFRDVSLGTITNKTICLSIKDCKASSWFVVTTGDAFTFIYPDFGKYFISMDVTDTYANSANKKWTLNLTTGINNVGDFHILSIPKVSITSGAIDFFVGKNLNNSILLYIKYDDSRGTCYVDTDIAFDSDNDGIKDNDKDFLCNQLYLKKYEPKYESVVWRIYYTKADATLISKDFTVSFLDFEANLDPAMTIVYKEINDFINTMSVDTTWSTGEFRMLLVWLRDGLIDQTNTKSNLVSVKDYYETHQIALTDEQNTLLKDTFTKLTDKSVSAAEWGNAYQQSKAEILSILPSNLAVDVEWLFKEFESVVSDAQANSSQQDKRKQVLQDIINLIKKNLATDSQNVKENQIDPLDMTTIIMPDMCKILAFYSIVSDTCPNDNVKIVANANAIKSANATWWSSWWKIILIILWILVGAFVVLVIIFAVRAKMNQQEENSEITPSQNP